MKPFLPRLVALLFFIFAAVYSRKSVTSKRNRPTEKSLKLSPMKRHLPKPSSKKQRKLEQTTQSTSSFSTVTQKQTMKTRIFTQSELSTSLENYGHQAWEVANGLRILTHDSEVSNKNGHLAKVAVTPQEELKIKEGISAVREANTILKYYIDHFILTEEVLTKYEQYIQTHPREASSTNGILKFMIHEFRDIHLRRFERDFFEKVKMYNSVIKEKFNPLFFLPPSDKFVRTLITKLLNAERLIIFIKKYMAFITKLSRGVHLLDYEHANTLYKQPDVDPHVDRVKVVSNEEFAKKKSTSHEGKHSSYIPVTILLGNEEYGSAPPPSPKLPSDYIENKEEVSVSHNHIQSSTLQTLTTHTANSVNEDQDGNQFQKNSPDESGTGTLVSLKIPAKKLLQSEPGDDWSSQNVVPHKLINPLELEKNEFINKKMREVERMYISTHQNEPELTNKPEKKQVSQDGPQNWESRKGENGIQNTVTPQDTPTSVLTSQLAEEATKSTIADKILRGEDRTKSIRNQNALVETSSQKLIELDHHGLPINLKIHRVPEIIRMDERYEDPLIFGGKIRNGISGKATQIEGKPLDQDFKSQVASQPPEEIPQRRYIYDPKAVNGGLQPIRKNPVDEQVKEIDRIINDNDTFDDKKLKQLGDIFGTRMSRKLWSEDLGTVYSRMIKGGLI